MRRPSISSTSPAAPAFLPRWLGAITAVLAAVLLLVPAVAAQDLLETLASPDEQEGVRFGTSVAGVPDADGDGAGDLLVGAPLESGGGRAHLYSGATGELLQTLASPNPDFAGNFGGSVAGVPDADGDGRGDLLVGADREDPGAGSFDAGAVHLFSGATGALLHSFGSPNAEFDGHFGFSVAGVPDADGDGFGDLLIGAPDEDPGAAPFGAGRVYLFSGTTGMLLAELDSPNEQGGGEFGFSVVGVPDADGDGRGDLLVGAKDEAPGASPKDAGRAYLFSGATGTLLFELPSPDEETEGSFGFSVAGVPDADGDGRGDLLVGAPFEDPDGAPPESGRAYLFSGATGALLSELTSPNAEAFGVFGSSVAGVPDADGDGAGDLLIGASLENPAGSPTDAGRAYLFSGASGALLFELRSPNGEFRGRFGNAAAGVADVDGDGRGDLLVGAWQEDPGAAPDNAGRAYLFSGASAPLPPLLPIPLASPNEQENGAFGFDLSAVPDTDGDGRADLLVGADLEAPGNSPLAAGRAYLFDAAGDTLFTLASPNEETAGRFGLAVSGVPDADGDGHGDLLVGAPREGEGAALALDAGRAYLFSGATGALLHTLTSPNAEADGRFGSDVSGVADVDGDGRGDLLVGARSEDPGSSPTDAGRAYLFSGATGALLRTLASPREQRGSAFGREVSGVPDADGDGRGDLLVGVANEDVFPTLRAGRAYLFSGATGALLHSLISPNRRVDGRFGNAVAGVEDVDGDGRGDLLVGAAQEELDSSLEDAGRAYLFSGATGTVLRILASPNEEVGGRFGNAVAGVPDVTGDGRVDLLVGAWGEDPGSAPDDAGRAYLFSGATGVLTGAFSSPNEEQDGRFGWSVAGLLDTDGDERGDFLIGAYTEDPKAAPTDAGRAYLFSGGGAPPAAVDLTAQATTSLTVAPGGSVAFSYTITNNSAAPVTGDLYYTAGVGGGTVAQGLIVSGTLPAGAFAGTYTQGVPMNAPAGAYDYCLRVGTFPTGTTDEACFTLVITGSIAARAPGTPATWPVTAVTPWASTAEAPALRADVAPDAVQAFPNPFRSQVTLRFALEEAGSVRLVVYDALGREVAVLVDGAAEAGQHAAVLDGSGLAAGVYLWRLEVGGAVRTGRLTLLR